MQVATTVAIDTMTAAIDMMIAAAVATTATMTVTTIAIGKCVRSYSP